MPVEVTPVMGSEGSYPVLFGLLKEQDLVFQNPALAPSIFDAPCAVYSINH